MQKYMLKMTLFSLMVGFYFGSLSFIKAVEGEEEVHGFIKYLFPEEKEEKEKEELHLEKPIYDILARQDAEEEYSEYMKHSKYGFGFMQPPKVEEEYKNLVKEYKHLENNLKYIRKIPLASMWGGINYDMSLNEMKRTVIETFGAMEKNGLIISKKDFEKIKNNYYIQKPHNDSTRIWGNQYLKNQINKSEFLKENYDVPSYIIVRDNEQPIKVTISFFNHKYPSVTELENGTIYFEKIIGIPVADKGLDTREIGIPSGIGYDDFSDPGNIILDKKTGKKYVVDTESKSFNIPLSYKFERLLKYAYKRFMYLNKDKINILHFTFDL